MAEQVTIKRVFRDPVNTKFGPGMRTSIYTSEYPEVRMSTFAKGIEGWKEGDKVSVDITRNGDYTNFKPVATGKEGSGLEARVAKIERHLGLDENGEATIQTDQTGDFDDFN